MGKWGSLCLSHGRWQVAPGWRTGKSVPTLEVLAEA